MSREPSTQDRLTQLFSLEPSEFIAARDALVKELREAGDKEAAAEVKALRRPTVAAWAVNQLARSDPDRIEELVEAGEALRTASLGRTGAKDLREAVSHRRDVVKRLTEATKRILPSPSATETNLSAIAQTLEAASDGRVECLVFQEGVEHVAAQCPACGRVSLSGGRCPLDGTEMEKRDEGLDLAVHQVLAHGGQVLALRRPELEPVGGIGSILRY